MYEIMSQDLSDNEINIFSIKLKNKKPNKINTFTEYVNSIMNILFDNQMINNEKILENIYKKQIVYEIEIAGDDNSLKFDNTALYGANKVCEGIKLLKEYINIKISEEKK
jgi:hypothetical protein